MERWMSLFVCRPTSWRRTYVRGFLLDEDQDQDEEILDCYPSTKQDLQKLYSIK